MQNYHLLLECPMEGKEIMTFVVEKKYSAIVSGTPRSPLPRDDQLK